ANNSRATRPSASPVRTAGSSDSGSAPLTMTRSASGWECVQPANASTAAIQIRMTNDETRDRTTERLSTFGLRITFVIRHSFGAGWGGLVDTALVVVLNNGLGAGAAVPATALVGVKVGATRG